MFIIFLITLTLQKNKKCWCSQYAFRDRCENNPVCVWNFDVAKCQDIPCIDRSIDECKLYGGDLFCVYNQRKAECETMDNCNMLSNDSITNLTTYDECFNKQCFYDFENHTCGYDEKICRDYDSLHCSGAFQVVGYDLVQCQLNGNDGRQCDLVLTCSDITFKGSCEVNIYCQWEDKKKLQDCPSFNPYAQELCIPISGNCTAFKCDQIQTSLQCDMHPFCAWGDSINQCFQVSCSQAIDQSQCYAFYSLYDGQFCNWVNGACVSCQYATILMIYIFTFYF
ncbi:hypothetical protein pb186bvf_005712 [Paramecium bursaria]